MPETKGGRNLPDAVDREEHHQQGGQEPRADFRIEPDQYAETRYHSAQDD